MMTRLERAILLLCVLLPATVGLVEARPDPAGTEAVFPLVVQGTLPSSDDCENATVISSIPYADSTDTQAATIGATDPIPPCGDLSQGKSVWYRFTAPFDGTVSADTFDTSYDTVVAVYTGSCGSLTPVPGACNDDATSDVTQSEAKFPIVAGATYMFVITAFEDDGGTLAFHLQSLTPPVNDNCATPEVITTASFQTTLSTIDATTAVSDPLQSCTFDEPNQNANSVWYSFTAPSDGVVTADTIGSDYDTLLTAYTGDCAALSEIACNDDAAFPDVTSQIEFPVTAGTTYLVEPTHYALVPDGSTLEFLFTFVAAGPGATPTPSSVCRGDCSGDGLVTVDEIVKGVNIALGSRPVDDCLAFDGDMSGTVTVDELVKAIGNALTGC